VAWGIPFPIITLCQFNAWIAAFAAAAAALAAAACCIANFCDGDNKLNVLVYPYGKRLHHTIHCVHTFLSDSTYRSLPTSSPEDNFATTV
jgi:hypothetical protein